MVRLILASLPKGAATVRVHVSGDFLNQDYFDAWMIVAWVRPGIRFYAYTKALPLWAARLASVPDNFVLTASMGGTHDELAEVLGLRTARVVLSEGEAEALGLAIDHDDSHAMNPGGDFALLIHGTQPPGSEASKAWQALKSAGRAGYGEKSGRRVALATV
jgi:Gene product 88